jgi:hypothetical protein
MIKLTKEEQIIASKIKQLKEAARSHSPSIVVGLRDPSNPKRMDE